VFLFQYKYAPSAIWLQASSGSLRLYAADNLRTADRTTLKKAALDGRFGFVGAFSSAHGPGVACIAPDGTLKVCAL